MSSWGRVKGGVLSSWQASRASATRIYSKRFRSSRNDKRGFTLIEVIVVVGIMVVIVTVGTGLLTNVIRGSNKARVLNLMRQQANAAMDAIERDIRVSVGLPLAESTCTTEECRLRRITLLQPGGTSAVRYTICAYFNASAGVGEDPCTSCPDNDNTVCVGHIRRFTCSGLSGRQFQESACVDDGPVTNTTVNQGIAVDPDSSKSFFRVRVGTTTIIEPQFTFYTPTEAKTGKGGRLSNEQVFTSTFVMRN